MSCGQFTEILVLESQFVCELTSQQKADGLLAKFVCELIFMHGILELDAHLVARCHGWNHTRNWIQPFQVGNLLSAVLRSRSRWSRHF